MSKISRKRRRGVIRLKHKRREKILKLKTLYVAANSIEERTRILEKIKRIRPEVLQELTPPRQKEQAAEESRRDNSKK